MATPEELAAERDRLEALAQKSDEQLLREFLIGKLSNPRRRWTSVTFSEHVDQESVQDDEVGSRHIHVSEHVLGHEGSIEFFARWVAVDEPEIEAVD